MTIEKTKTNIVQKYIMDGDSDSCHDSIQATSEINATSTAVSQTLTDCDETSDQTDMGNSLDTEEIQLLQLLTRQKRAMVVGSVSIEEYVYGPYHATMPTSGDSGIASHSIAPDVNASNVCDKACVEHSLDGAARLAKHLRAFEMDVDILTILGAEDTNMQTHLEEAGIGTQGVIMCNNFKIPRNALFIAKGRLVSTVDKGHTDKLTDKEQDRFLKTFQTMLNKNVYDIISITERTVLLPDCLVQGILNIAKSRDIPTVVIPPNTGDIERYFGCMHVIVNIQEAQSVYGKETKCIDDIQKTCQILVDRLNSKTCVLVVPKKGFAVYLKSSLAKRIFEFVDSPITIPLHRDGKESMYTASAALIFCMSHAIALPTACKFASDCVSDFQRNNSPGVNLLNVVHQRTLYNKEELEALKKIIPKHKRVVLTTGCFDLFHYGHSETLRQAREIGDIVIVALNSDTSVKKSKGDSRPIYNIRQRLGVLLAVRYVDFIVVFDERRPTWVVETLAPDVLVKGEDYTETRLRTSYPNLRNVHITKNNSDCRSTTETLNMLRKL